MKQLLLPLTLNLIKTTINPLNPLKKKRRRRKIQYNATHPDEKQEKLSYTSGSLKMRVLTQFGEGGPDDRGGDEGEPD